MTLAEDHRGRPGGLDLLRRGGPPYLVEGVGEDFWPTTFDPAVVDRYVTVSDRDSFLTTRRLARPRGILAGGSCGMACTPRSRSRAGSTTPRRWSR